jgi:hypothetical protein
VPGAPRGEYLKAYQPADDPRTLEGLPESNLGPGLEKPRSKRQMAQAVLAAAATSHTHADLACVLESSHSTPQRRGVGAEEGEAPATPATPEVEVRLPPRIVNILKHLAAKGSAGNTALEKVGASLPSLPSPAGGTAASPGGKSPARFKAAAAAILAGELPG